MNERIKELWEQAVRGDGPHASVIADFAELIIKDCTDVIDQEALEERNDYAMRRIESCSWMIKDNFGIKQ